ncbi:TylF/MycF/NovP-related O-methyltransferase [Fulvivirgaceae bacterium LMO-SS25]
MNQFKLFFFRVIKSFFNIFNYDIINKEDSMILPKEGLTYSEDFLYTYHNAGFLQEEKFISAYQRAKSADDNGLLKHFDIQWRIHVLSWAANLSIYKEGDFVDCGGGSGIFASAIISYTNFNKYNKTYYLIDSFSGLSVQHSSDNEFKRSHKLYSTLTTEDKVLAIRERFVNDKVEIVKGFIPEIFNELNVSKISFLSVDLNSAIPEYECLNFFWDKIVSGGIIVLDDHGYLNQFEESRIQHEKFAKEKNVEILKLPTCQGIIIKP